MEARQKSRPKLPRLLMQQIVRQCVEGHILELQRLNTECLRNEECMVKSPFLDPVELRNDFTMSFERYLSEHCDVMST